MSSSSMPTDPGQTPQSTPDPAASPHGRAQGSGPGEVDDTSTRADPHAQHQAGSSSPGYRGGSGGTPDAGGLGRPGGAQSLAVGPSQTRDPSQATTPATGGMGAPKSGGPVGTSGTADEDVPPALTFGDARPYEAAHDTEHRFGELSVAGGSGGSALDSADALDEAAGAQSREQTDGPPSDQPSSGTAAG